MSDEMNSDMDGFGGSDSIHIGNAPCSWGTLEFDEIEGPQIGYEQMLDELVGTGYVGTELGDWAFMPTDPERLRSEMSARGLTMLGAFVPVAFARADALPAGEKHALEVARLLAEVSDVGDPNHEPFIILADDNGSDRLRTENAGRVTPDMMLDGAGWTTFAAGVERIARIVREQTGLPAAFHPHCAGYVETPEEIAALMDRTDPKLVGLVFDTGHYAFGSGSCEGVSDALLRFADRIRHVHYKDCDGELASRSRAEHWDYFTSLKHGIFCELGKGCVDFRSVTIRLRQTGYRGWIVVEQDVLPGMGEPRESAARNRRYLQDIGL
jgi:inosose dehydratase